MINRIIAVLLLGLLFCSAPLQATVTLESFKFATTQEEQRFKDLISQLRCLVCQNQSLADSDAELAHDLRAEVYGMMQKGNSDAQVIDFLVARYGDFVLYNPPVKPSTWLIWFGPFVVLLIAAVLLFRSLRRQQQAPQQEITGSDRQHLEQLLHDVNPGKGRHT